MFKRINAYYAWGFAITIAGLCLGMFWISTHKNTRYQMLSENTTNRVGITILTNQGPFNLDRIMLDHYFDKIKNNLEYLSKRIDPDKCEYIKTEISKARESLQNQVNEHMEKTNLQKDQVHEERLKIKARIQSMSDIVFLNDKEKEDTKSIMYEMILNLETLLYLTKIIPYDIDSIDTRDVDQLVKLLYEKACVTNYNESSKSDDNVIDNTPEKPFEESFIAVTKRRPGPFETFVDFNKNQNLVETRLGTVLTKPLGFKEKKIQQKNKKEISMITTTDTVPEKYQPSVTREHAIPLQAKGKDPIRDRINQARDEFISSQPNRFRKTKNSLVENYNELEDSSIFPGLAFAY